MGSFFDGSRWGDRKFKWHESCVNSVFPLKVYKYDILSYFLSSTDYKGIKYCMVEIQLVLQINDLEFSSPFQSWKDFVLNNVLDFKVLASLQQASSCACTRIIVIGWY